MKLFPPASPSPDAFAPAARVRDLVLHLFAWVASVVPTSAALSPPVFWAIDGLAPDRFGFLRVARRVATVLAVVLLWYWFRGDRIRSFRSLGATREGWRTGVAWRYAIGGALTVAVLVACERALGVRVLDIETPRFGPWLRAVEILVAALAIALLEELVFRGALLFPFGRLKGAALFVQTTLVSAIYSTVHFARGSSGKGMAVDWTSGLETWKDLVATATVEREAWAGLFALGCWLNLLARRQGHVWGVVGIHAGAVVALKLAGDLTEAVRPHSTPFFTAGFLPGWGSSLLLLTAALVTLGGDRRAGARDRAATTRALSGREAKASRPV